MTIACGALALAWLRTRQPSLISGIDVARSLECRWWMYHWCVVAPRDAQDAFDAVSYALWVSSVRGPVGARAVCDKADRVPLAPDGTLAPLGTPKPAACRPRMKQSDEEENYLEWEDHMQAMDCELHGEE